LERFENKEAFILSELTKQIKADNHSAFEILFKLNYEPLVNYAKAFVTDHETAYEIVQETFIKFWENRKSLDENYSVKSFLFRCVHNNCINFIKKAKTIKQQSEDYQNDQLLYSEILDTTQYNSFFEDFNDVHLEKKIASAIELLPQQCKEIFMLCRFDNKSYKDIAAKLDISVNTVKTQLKRALEKLRNAVAINN
jgi:RNA polymerase sigma-70 factor, ECF subfamily